MTGKLFGLIVAAGILTALAVVNDARAVVLLSNGEIELFDSGGAPTHLNPPLEDITRMSLSGGRVFTNQVAGAPFSVGSTVRTIGIFTIGSAVNGTNIPAQLPNTTNLNVIFALEGTIIAPGPTAVASFTTGRAFLVSDVTGQPPLTTYDLNHATTWNFPNVFAEFDLLASDSVVDGSLLGILGHTGTPIDGSGHLSFPAAAVNVSSANTVVPFLNQGIFLFGEDSSAAQNAGLGFVDPGLAGPTADGFPDAFGDDFLRSVDTAPGLPKSGEVIVPVTNQTILSGVPGVTFAVPTAADILVMDAIGAAAGFGAGSFSAGGYTPTSLGGGTGDFVADLTGDTYVGYQVIPEPASSLVWLAMVSGCALVVGLRRKSLNRQR